VGSPIRGGDGLAIVVGVEDDGVLSPECQCGRRRRRGVGISRRRASTLRRWSSWMRRPALRWRPSGSAADIGDRKKAGEALSKRGAVGGGDWLAAWAGRCARGRARVEEGCCNSERRVYGTLLKGAGKIFGAEDAMPNCGTRRPEGVGGAAGTDAAEAKAQWGSFDAHADDCVTCRRTG